MMESGDLKNRSHEIHIEPVDEQQRDPCWMFLGTERRSAGWTHCVRSDEEQGYLLCLEYGLGQFVRY